MGGTMKYDGVTYEFVEKAADADAANVAVVITKTADDKAIATAFAGAFDNTKGAIFKDGAAAAGSGDAATKVTLTAKDDGVATAPTEVETEDMGLMLQIGDTADSYNQLKVSVGDMHTKALGIDSSSISVKTQAEAAEAVKKIKDAINTVSSTRGDLGAIQNRLEHTNNNLAIMTENIQDAESTIRDVDIADEMTTYTKNNILLQSAQAMLAQANQMPQGVLQLLQ